MRHVRQYHRSSPARPRPFHHAFLPQNSQKLSNDNWIIEEQDSKNSYFVENQNSTKLDDFKF